MSAEAPESKRLSLVFIGQQNFYTDYLVDWMNTFVDVRGVIWTAANRNTRAARFEQFRKRIKRGGFVRAMSELFYFVGSKFKFGEDEASLRKLIREERAREQVPVSSMPAIHVPNLRAPEVLKFLDQVKPDVLFTQCINELIPKNVYTYPPQGCYVFHEGVVPQYRGKFCTHWAVLNGDFDLIGASVIKVEAGLDAGPVAFIEHVRPQTLGRGHQWLEHEVLFLALPRLKQWLEDLAAGRATLTPQTEKYPLYSYPLFSHLWRVGRRKKECEEWRTQSERSEPVAAH